jgi:hypothetical protein
MFSVSILSFDMKFPDSQPAVLPCEDVRLNSFLQVCRSLVVKYYQFENRELDQKKLANSQYRVASQFVLFFELLHTLPLWVQQYILQESIDDLDEEQENKEFSSSKIWKEKVEELKSRKNLLFPSLETLVDSNDYYTSQTHLLFEKEMLYNFTTFFPKEGKHFTIENEFCGLQYPIFPVDIAVRYKGQLIAFIEVHGSGHQKDNRFIHVNPITAVSRSDLLKRKLYSYHYPDILYLTADHISFAKDPDRAKIISKDMAKKIVTFLIRRLREPPLKLQK